MTVARLEQTDLYPFEFSGIKYESCFDCLEGFGVMATEFDSRSSLMARLTISALQEATRDDACWKQPVVHRAVLVSGLSVLIASMRLLSADLRST